MRDINGKEINVGDWIQGYNNRKYAGDKSKLYPTHPMRAPSSFEDTFENYPKTNSPWVWKVDIREKPLDLENR